MPGVYINGIKQLLPSGPLLGANPNILENMQVIGTLIYRDLYGMAILRGVKGKIPVWGHNDSEISATFSMVVSCVSKVPYGNKQIDRGKGHEDQEK